VCNPGGIAKTAKIAKIAKIVAGILAIPAILAILAILAMPRAAPAGLDDPRPLSLNVTHPTPIRTVLQLLFRGTAVTAVVPDSMTGTFSGELRNVTLRQALDAVLARSGFGYALHGAVIHVVPRVHAQEGRR
jgi:type II secretory pathway component HofQ